MSSLTRIPLHYQILIALIFGTALGLILNPGDARLDDVKITLQPDDPEFRVITRDMQGHVVADETFADFDALRRRYAELARLYRQQEEERSLTVHVTDRKVHFAEELDRITITYTRRYDGRSVVTTDRAEGPQDLAERYPHWKPLYEKHGGGIPRYVSVSAKTIGDLFLRLLRMITVPLIVTSLVTGIAGLGATKRFGSMFSKTVMYYVMTSILAITTGIMMVNIVRPGIGAELPGGGEVTNHEEPQSLGRVFLNMVESMIPANPIQSLAQADFLSIIFFSILLGIFIIHTGGKSAEVLRNFFQSAFDVMMNMTMFIIKLAPLGVFAFMLYATVSQGAEIFRTLAWYMLAVFLALSFHAVVVLPLLLKFVAKRSPWEYAQALSPALMTAFSTASSNGTLPLTMTCVEKRAGVSNRVGSFVLPLGATINMDGTALYEAVAVLFIAQATPGFAMSLEAQIAVALTALLASIGAAGIPHAGLVMMAIVLQAVGLSLEAQGVIIAVDRVLDMCRTTVNVWSDSCGCAIIERFEDGAEAATLAEPAPSQSS